MADVAIAPPFSNDWEPVVGATGYQFILDVYRRLGAEVDAVNKQSIQELYPWTFAFQTQESSKKTVTVTTGSAYTIVGQMIVNVTGAVTITLDPYPRDKQKATIYRNTTAGPVVLSGTINGDSSYTMLANHETIDLVYLVSIAGWIIT